MLIREAIRLSQAYVAFRRNVGPEMYIDGKVIPTGALVAYPAADVHLDPALYPDPWKFDPERPPPKGNLTYLGWGGGAFFCVASSTKRGLARIDRLFFFGCRVRRESDLHWLATSKTQYQAPYRAAARGF